MSIANPTPQPPKGSIIVESAYAQGKMIDHSKWSLSNGRALSDIDAVLDNNGHVLLIEFVRSWGPIGWGDISGGQRWLYQSIVRGSPKFVAVLARHNVASFDQTIDSRSDILDGAAIFDLAQTGVSLTGDEYRSLVEGWDRDPPAVIVWLRKLHDAKRAAEAQAISAAYQQQQAQPTGGAS